MLKKMNSSISEKDENKRRIDREKKRRKIDMLKSMKEKSECDPLFYKKKDAERKKKCKLNNLNIKQNK